MHPVDVFTLRIVAAQHGIDPRTLAKALRDGPDAVRGELARERVRQALRALSAAPEAPVAGRRA